jgi:myosin heavy subunit
MATRKSTRLIEKLEKATKNKKQVSMLQNYQTVVDVTYKEVNGKRRNLSDEKQEGLGVDGRLIRRSSRDF